MSTRPHPVITFADPHDVAYVLVTPVYPATLDAVGYYFDLGD